MTNSSPGWADLTDRERQVFQLLVAGKSNTEIAGELFLSRPTIKTHVSHLMRKLDARDRVQLVVLAYRCGLAQ